MDETQYDWTLMYAALLGVATLATLATMLLSFKQIKIHESAVQYITYSFCGACFCYSFSRMIFYVAALVNFDGVRTLLDSVADGQLFGVREIYRHEKQVSFVVIFIALCGDVALWSMTLWVIAMSFEMKRLISRSMDRGRTREQQIVRNYSRRVYLTSFFFAVVLLLPLIISSDSHGRKLVDIALIVQLGCICVSFAYPLFCAAQISLRKRVRIGVDPASLLLHQRIKNLVLVYAVLVFPSCVAEIAARCTDDVPMTFLGLSQALYYLSGGAAALVIGTSATCCYRTLMPIMPRTVYEELLANGYFPDLQSIHHAAAVEPPLRCPVFVCTDIEASTLLWSSDAEMMAEAQDLHDDLIRQLLPRFNGYEITTAGDAFQLAFHRVSDAIAFCVKAQEKLLKVHWPARLLKYKQAKRMYDSWSRRLLFQGLRVRMAIHDGDTQLISAKHPTTGKMTYMGTSEMAAREIVDQCKGGQILISGSALERYENELVQTMESGTLSPNSNSNNSNSLKNNCPKAGDELFTHQEIDHFERPDLGIAISLHEIVSTRIGVRFRKERETRILETLLQVQIIKTSSYRR